MGTAGDGRALLNPAEELKTDVVLVELYGAVERIRRRSTVEEANAKAKLILLATNPDSDIGSEVLCIDASGYLLKNSQGEELMRERR